MDGPARATAMMIDGVCERTTGGMAGPAVLVVDDDSSNLTAMCGLLSDLGAEVVAADSGADALRRVLRRDFCAILMDVRMPQLDGYETAALIRQRERSRHIPIKIGSTPCRERGGQ